VPPELEDVHEIAPPEPDPRLKDIEVEIKAQETAVRQHEAHVASARARVLAESLDPDPSGLRRLARAIDDADAAQQRAQAHAAHAAALRSTRDDAVRSLARALDREVGSEVVDDTVSQVFQAYEVYVAGCRERAGVAKLAGRRPDLIAAHQQRKQLELSHATASAERHGQVQAVRDLAIGLGIADGSNDAEAADRLREWVGAQEQKRETQAKRRELAARLDQLLDGRDLDDWQTDLAALVESAGPEPEPVPPDVERFRADAAARHQAVVTRAGQLEGQQQQLTQALKSVAEAVEQESEAERAKDQVETLASCIDAATEQLNLAKDRAHANIAPALEAKMRPWFPRITNGRYLDVAVEPSDLTMKVTEAKGAVRQAELLSHGTTEQLFLLLRITLSQVLSGDTETAPLILDDVTVQCDQTRTIAIMELLHEISADHQVLLFTQEQEVLAWAEANLGGSRDRLIALPAPA
jgi:DNA repair exonuclease SbcCD ATPase subunit